MQLKKMILYAYLFAYSDYCKQMLSQPEFPVDPPFTLRLDVNYSSRFPGHLGLKNYF